MRRRRRPFDVSIDSMMNIAVCMLNALILVIIATGVGTAETNLVIPTPIELHTTKRPIYIECRGNELFLIPIEELTSTASNAVQAVRALAAGSDEKFQHMLSSASATNELFRADLRHFIATGGKSLAVTPVAGTHGYPLTDYMREPGDGWFATLLSRMSPSGESIFFLVRDDSFPVFKNARLLAWQAGADVSFELLSTDESISFPTRAR